MIKKYLIFVFWAITVALLLYASRKYKGTDNAILAEVEPQRYAISFQKAIKVREIYVMPGQRVKKGDPLIKVERPDLLLDSERRENAIQSLTAEKSIKRVERDNRIALAELRHDQEVAKIKTEMDQLKMVMANNENLSRNLSSLNLRSDSVHNSDHSYLDLQLQMLHEEKANLDNQLNVEKAELDQVYQLEIQSIENEIKQLEQELELLQQEKNELIQYANVDGTIGNVYSEDEELVPPYTTLISVYEDNPTVIRALMNEHQRYDIKSGDKVTVESTNRMYKAEGVIMEVGSRIIEYPNRLRSYRDLPAWGRELFIKIPEKSEFLNGEKVFVIVKK